MNPPDKIPDGLEQPAFDRDDILSGKLEQMAREAMPDQQHRITPAEQRLAKRDEILAQLEPGEDPWLFGYGSLIWNPACDVIERRVSTLYGYHRRFCFWSTAGRGTQDNPGMMLALEPGGSCQGVALRIDRKCAEEELKSVFLREMMTGSYHVRLVRTQTDDGPVRAIAFIANRGHDNYAGRVPSEIAAIHIAKASGHLGTCKDYLKNTLAHLESYGLRDGHMDELLQLVEAEQSK